MFSSCELHAFRDRLLAARESLTTGKSGAAAAPAGSLAVGSAQYVTAPSAAHSMQHGSGSSSLELQQLQEINAGIKQASCTHFSLLIFVVLPRRLCHCARVCETLLPDESAAAGSTAAGSKHSIQILRGLISPFIITRSLLLQIYCVLVFFWLYCC
jgi:hypothetical protein